MVWLKRDSLQPAPRRSVARSKPAAVVAGAHSPAPDIATRLRGFIETGHFERGAKLPPERALAAELGVGRPAVREAIKVLCGLGVLESRRGSGTYLRSSTTGIDMKQLPADLGTAEFSAFELLEVRKILEPRAAWLAATRASHQQLLDIEHARNRLEMRDRDWKVVARLDYELHASIFRGANNPVLLLIYEFLMSRLLGSPEEKLRFPPDLEAMRSGHKAVVEAILKRQPDAAEKAMTEHLQSVGVNLIREASR